MPGGMQLKAEVLTTSACSLCGACLDWCPYLKNLEDHLVLRFDCPVQEGRCYSICPRTMTDWQEIQERFLPDVPGDRDLGAHQAVYRVKSKRPLANQQDGGTVSALLETILHERLADALLLTGGQDSLTPSPFITSDPQDIAQAAGSRFLASPGLRQLQKAREQGFNRLAMVGRPCQVQALRKMQVHQTQDRPEADVLSLGLFCMWSLSWKFKDYLTQAYPEASFTRMAIPQHSVELLSNQGVEHLPTDAIRPYIRPGCLYCLDMTSELADVSIGAFEPVPGWNTVVVRSERGRELFEKARSNGSLQVENYPPEELERLQKASRNKKIRALQAIQQAVEEQRIIPFVDLSREIYQQLLQSAEGKVGS